MKSGKDSTAKKRAPAKRQKAVKRSAPKNMDEWLAENNRIMAKLAKDPGKALYEVKPCF